MVDIVDIGLSVDSRSVDKGKKSLNGFAAQGKKTQTATEKLNGSLKKQTAAYIQLAVKVGIAMLAYRAITGVTNTFIENTIKQEQAMRQLEVAVESTGGAAGFTAIELREMAQEMQKVTTFGDEAVMEMQGILLTFTNIKETLPGTTEAVADLAIRMGTDLKSAAIQLGKALNDPIANLSALSRSGIQFSKDQKEVINSLVEAGEMAEAQKVILAELNVQFGGSARAARDTFGGALESLGNTFGDLFEASEETSRSLASVVNEMNAGLSASGFYEAAVRGLAEAFFQMSDASDPIGEKLRDAAGEAWNLQDSLETIKRLNKEGGIIQKALYGGPEKQAEAQRLFDEKMEQMRNLAAALEIPAEKAQEDTAELDRITELAELKSEAQAEIDAAIQQAAAIHFGIMHEIESNALIASEKARADTEKKRLKQVEKDTAGLIGMAQSGNKSITELARQAALDKAKIYAKEAIIGAYNWGTGVGGPYMGAAAAVVASLATGAMISALKGGGEGATAPAATISSVPSPEAPIPTTEVGAPITTTDIIVSGGLHTDEDVRNLIARVNEVQADMGGTSNFVVVAG